MAFKIYTRTGDTGKTGLFGGTRVNKDDLRVEAYGEVDELNSFLGLVRDHLPADTEDVAKLLLTIQHRLFTIGALLATAPGKETPVIDLTDMDITQLETAIDTMEGVLAPLKNFILPGGHPVVSHTHVARCVCRRAERRVVHLHHHAPIPELVLRYLNRLSDYLFVLARYLGHQTGAKEIIWVAR